MNDMELKRRISLIEPWMIEMRRDLHRTPEPGFKEFKTQRTIIRALDECGIPYAAERTWVVGLIEGAHPGKTVALRADIDGLPIRESEDCAFSSQNPGYMHACGHDAHAAILLGAARALSGMRDRLHGSVKLLFQPAEESEGGALPMVNAGVLENPRVDEVYGLHVQPYLPVGAVETRAGTLNAATDEIIITVRGFPCHSAYPEQGVDAILCASEIVAALNTITARNISPLQSAVVSVCSIEGGTASNVLCGEVRMTGTLRAATSEIRNLLLQRTREVASHIAWAMSCTAEVEIHDGYPALVNDERSAHRVLDLASRLLGRENALYKPAPSMGGEDFAYFIRDIPGAFYHIGCSTPGKTGFAPLHSGKFQIDEDCLKVGALMQTALALDVLGGTEA